MIPCPKPEQWHAFLKNPDVEDERDAYRQHLSDCERCQRLLDSLCQDDALSEMRQARGRMYRLPEMDSRQLLEELRVEYGSTDPPQSTLGPALRLATDADDASLPQPGDVLGHFRIQRLIAVGGMGAVYESYDEQLQRLVALKVLRQPADDPESRSRFLREAQTAAQVRHANVVSIFGLADSDFPRPLLIMEYVEGITLREAFSQRLLSVQETAEVIQQAALGLQAVHDVGVVHRDVKPGNIMLETRVDEEADGATPLTARLMDFGLARIVAAESDLTNPNVLPGTPHYLSPEQIHPGTSTERSDVYSLGVTLYEGLTGELPFRGTPLALLRQISETEPPVPRQYDERIPMDLEVICLKAMAKDPQRRYPSAGAMAEDLGRWLRGEPIAARPVGAGERLLRWGRRNRSLAAMSATAILLLVCLAVGSTVAAILLSGQTRAIEYERRLAEDASEAAQQQAAAAVMARSDAEKSATRATRQRDLALEAHDQLVRGVQETLQDVPGTLELRTSLLTGAIDGLQELVDSAADDHRADLAIITAHRRLGELSKALGNTEQAGAQFRQAVELARQRAENSQDTDTQLELALALVSLGDFALLNMDLAGATETLEEARDMWQSLSAMTSQRENSLRNLAVTLNKLGDLHMRSGKTGEAAAQYRDARDSLDQIEASTSEDPLIRRDYRLTLRRIGDCRLMSGQIGAAVNLYRESLRLAEQEDLTGFRDADRNSLVESYGRLGLVLSWLGEAEEAEASIEAAQRWNQFNLARDPKNVVLQRKEAVFLQRHADIEMSRARYAAAQDYLQQALLQHRTLEEIDPQAEQAKIDLVTCLEQLARCMTKTEAYEEAIRHYQAALEILKAREAAGTLTDPISIAWRTDFESIVEILRRLPEALEQPIEGDALSLEARIMIQAERAIVLARRGKASESVAAVDELLGMSEELEAARKGGVLLYAARALALSAALESEDDQSRARYAQRATRLLQDMVELDAFSATHLKFEPELGSLHGEADFEQLFRQFCGDETVSP